jgi:hypothetical protein
MWNPVVALTDIPKDRDLRLGVLDGQTIHTLVFPCRIQDHVWVDAKTGRSVEIYLTHWQEWSAD